MSGRYYRRPSTTLESLMEAGGEGIAPPTTGYEAPAGNSQLQELLSQAFAPQDIGPPPEEYKPKVGSRIAAALGDALSAYSRAFVNTQPTNYRAGQRDREQDSRDKKTQYDRAKSLAAGDAGRDKARYMLGEKQRELEAKAARIAESKAEKALQDKIKRDQDAEASRRAFELQKMGEDHRLDQQEQGARFKHEEGLKRLEASLRTGDDPKADKALQSFSLGSRIANGILRGVPESKDGPAIPPLSVRLAGDPENNLAPQAPDVIRREFEDEMTQEGIFGPARDLARDYFNERLIRTYREMKKAARPQDPGT